MHHEPPSIMGILAGHFPHSPVVAWLAAYESSVYSLLIIAVIVCGAWLMGRKLGRVSSRLQVLGEILAQGTDDFVSSVLGPQGRRFTPFIGTLFIYIVCMNMFGLIPLFRSPTAQFTTTLSLAICVFFYVQYAAFKELRLAGYLDHLAGNPRGIIALSIFMPVIMFFVHLTSEFVRPISLALRLRSNVWGDDFLLTILSGFGLQGLPLMLFAAFLTLAASVIQAFVFCLLTTVYFAMVLVHEDKGSGAHERGK